MVCFFGFSFFRGPPDNGWFLSGFPSKTKNGEPPKKDEPLSADAAPWPPFHQVPCASLGSLLASLPAAGPAGPAGRPTPRTDGFEDAIFEKSHRKHHQVLGVWEPPVFLFLFFVFCILNLEVFESNFLSMIGFVFMLAHSVIFLCLSNQGRTCLALTFCLFGEQTVCGVSFLLSRGLGLAEGDLVSKIILDRNGGTSRGDS